MIQADTISTGSAPTVRGHRCVLDQLDQRIAEHDFPRRGSEVFSDREAVCNARRAVADWSCSKLLSPRTRLGPPLVRVASITSGLSQGTLDGDIRSSHCRTVEGHHVFIWPALTPPGLRTTLFPPFFAEQHRLG